MLQAALSKAHSKIGGFGVGYFSFSVVLSLSQTKTLFSNQINIEKRGLQWNCLDDLIQKIGEGEEESFNKESFGHKNLNKKEYQKKEKVKKFIHFWSNFLVHQQH